MADPRTYHFRLPKSKRQSEIVLGDPCHLGTQKHWPKCTTKRSVDTLAGVVAVVIHAAAGSSPAGAVSVMKKATDPASFHWLVPDADEPQQGQFVCACVPRALAAWRVRNAVSHPDVNDGEKRVNHQSLGIEVVNLQKNDPFVGGPTEVVDRCVKAGA